MSTLSEIFILVSKDQICLVVADDVSSKRHHNRRTSIGCAGNIRARCTLLYLPVGPTLLLQLASRMVALKTNNDVIRQGHHHNVSHNF